ncbi:MAG TPA: hypothetical protein VGM84_13030 [Steroidobacteraceae bacterium]|jgi:hypothetical protein
MITTAGAQEKTALPGATYESIKTLPDWSGWWGLEGPLSAEFQRVRPPLKPQLMESFYKTLASDVGGFRDLYCRPNEFTGYSGGFVESIEFLFTPARVTLTSESGLIRRIYTDGRSLPKDVDFTTTGTSVGHWEGQTLVVETVGIDPKALYPQLTPAAIAIGRNAQVTERIFLSNPETLHEVTTVAPDILAAPDKRTRVYSRVHRSAALQISFCANHDRAVDPRTGKQRFDMTPPPDLPPPPAH